MHLACRSREGANEHTHTHTRTHTQGSSPLKSSSNAKRKGGDVAGSSHMSAAMKVGSDGSNAPVVFWGRAVHACAWAAHVLLARSFSVSMVCPYGVPTMVARHCMDVSLLRVVVQTLQLGSAFFIIGIQPVHTMRSFEL
eukprot:scaffold11668_cov21-Tisochrysis_lutea.AAC.2